MTTSPSRTPSPRLSAERSQQDVLGLTVIYFFIELSGGLYFHSLALITDASFMAINVVGQLLAIFAARLAEKLPSRDNTFGFERAKVLSGLFNGVLVGFLVFYVLIEAYRRISHPEPLEAGKVLIIAILGLAVNAYGLFRFNRHANLSHIKGARLLVLNDTLGSVGVIVSSLIIYFAGWYFLDPLTGVLISLLVGYPTYHLIKDSVHILMEGNPSTITSEQVEHFILKNFVHAKIVKDVHIWGLSSDSLICVMRVRTSYLTKHRETVKTIKGLLTEQYGFSDIFVEEYEMDRGESTASERNC